MAEELDLVHVFQVEINRTLLAVHFEAVLVLAPARVARGFEGAI